MSTCDEKSNKESQYGGGASDLYKHHKAVKITF